MLVLISVLGWKKNHINLNKYISFLFQFFSFIFSFNFPTISLKIHFIFPHCSLFVFPNPEPSSLFFPQTQDSPQSFPISYSSLNHWCLCHLSSTRTTLTTTIISLDSTINSFMGSLPLSIPLTYTKLERKIPPLIS